MQSSSDYSNMKKYIKEYKCVLYNFLTPLPLLDMMPEFNSQVKDNILSLHDRPQEQVDLFLNELDSSVCDSSADWQAFLDALNNSEEQNWLYRLLMGTVADDEVEKVFDYVANADAMKKLFRLIKPELNKIDAQACIDLLATWLSDEEMQCLRAKYQECGNNYTMWWLISFLTRKGPGWIKEFYDFVKSENYRNLAEGTLAKLLLSYFDLDINESDDSFESYNASSSQQMLVETVNEAGGLKQSDGIGEHASLYSEPSNTESNLNQIISDCDDNIKQGDTRSNTVNNLQIRDDQLQSSKEINLRNYQKELVELATEGKNVIICAPPGAGKTVIAAYIVRDYLEKSSNRCRKVLFFTPGASLAAQQKERLEQFIVEDYTVSMCVGGLDSTSALEVTETYIVVLTPQILLNILRSKEEMKVIKSLSEFELLIFDECHHCMKGDPYNAVMREYFYLKNKHPESDCKLPQIVGLTATLGVGNNLQQAFDGMLKLCANLDIMDGIVTVKDPDNRAELYKHVPQPDEETKHLGVNDENPFYCRLKNLMDQIGNSLKETQVCESIPIYENNEVKKQTYKSWCVNSKNEISQSEFPRARDAISCVEYLEMLSDALDLQFKCRAKDGFQYIQDFVNRVETKNINSNEKNLFSMLKAVMEEIRAFCNDTKCDNPNLKDIEKLLLKTFKKNPNSKGLLMVQKRIYTRALKDWLHETDSLRFLNAATFTGLGNSNAASGTSMTHKQQETTMESFRKGHHKLLVCTPAAAGEGLDFVDCNIVINYDYIKSETLMIQIKGRVRKSGGEMHQLSSSRVAHHDQLNQQKTVIMEEATAKLQELIDNDKVAYQKRLVEIQKRSQYEYQLALSRKLLKQPRTSDQEYRLQCKKCKADVCSSFDMRIVANNQHVLPTPEFKEKYETEDHPRKKPMGGEWRKKSKIFCKGCGENWGIEGEWKGCITLPLIKISGLRVVETNKPKRKAFTPRRWKDAPFVPVEANLDDMINELDLLANED